MMRNLTSATARTSRSDHDKAEAYCSRSIRSRLLTSQMLSWHALRADRHNAGGPSAIPPAGMPVDLPFRTGARHVSIASAQPGFPIGHERRRTVSVGIALAVIGAKHLSINPYRSTVWKQHFRETIYGM